MSDTNNHELCRVPGCMTAVPPELEDEVLCVLHFLSVADNVCAAIRREKLPYEPDAPRRIEVNEYIAKSAMKLANLGTGTLKLSDETKKRILTTFHTLMILRESLDRDSDRFRPRRQIAKSTPASALVAA